MTWFKKHKANLLLMMASSFFTLAVAEFAAQKYIEHRFFDELPYLTIPDDEFNFLSKYADKVHHTQGLGFLDILGLEHTPANYHNYIWTELVQGEKQVLIQGDSWAEAFVLYTDYPALWFKNEFVTQVPLALEKMKKLKINFKIVGGGVASYSPSLMAAQLDVLVEDFALRPQLIVAIIDQTDLRDELCFYKDVRKIDAQGHITVFNPTFFWDEQKIMRGDDFALVKLLKRKIYKQVNEYLPNEHERCGDYQIEKLAMRALSEQEVAHFTQTLHDYINRVFSYDFVERMVFVTHFNMGHVKGVFKLDVTDYVKEALATSRFKDRIDLIAFTPADYGDMDVLTLFQQESPHYGHLTNEAQAGLYTDKIIEWIKEHR